MYIRNGAFDSRRFDISFPSYVSNTFFETCGTAVLCVRSIDNLGERGIVFSFRSSYPFYYPIYITTIFYYWDMYSKTHEMITSAGFEIVVVGKGKGADGSLTAR
jgi:hypothetical protein